MFAGDVVLGDRVRIGPYAVITDSVLGDDCVVHEQCVIDGVVSGSHCEIGPFARLRPGTQFEARVEGRQLRRGQGESGGAGQQDESPELRRRYPCRAGCEHRGGTITCNYDGAAKHRTLIGDRVFVGSGAMLVAPVSVGAGATIAAGSTITQDVGEGTLAVARNRQTTVKGWKRPEKPSK